MKQTNMKLENKWVAGGKSLFYDISILNGIVEHFIHSMTESCHHNLIIKRGGINHHFIS